MKAEFNNGHLVAYGEKFYKYTPPHAYYCDPGRYPLSQIQVCITGDPKYILDKLKKITDEMEFEIKNGELNKPNEGILAATEGYTSEVIVPVWNNKVDESVDLDLLYEEPKEFEESEGIQQELVNVAG